MQAEALVGGRYRLGAIAGAGGMGTVYLARDLETGRRCAVKLVAADAAPRARERFALEAGVLAKVSHPSVVRYLDHGDSPPFLVMEWVEGECLADRLQRGGVTPEDALRLGEKLALALAAVHAAGVVHRDVKPRNVMLPGGSFDAPVLVDFGVARSPDVRHTGTGARVGTPRYMAPEQIVSARRVDGRADVFSLGCVLFEMLTGRRTFRGRDEVALLARMVIEDAPRLRSVRSDLPPEVDALVARLLARDPKRRPRATDELAREIGTLATQLRGLRAAERAAESELDSTRDETPGETPGEIALLAALTPWPTPAEPPWPTVGRDAELAQLAGELAPGAVVGLWGAIGVGKSHLALALAHAASRARGAIVCDVRGASGDEIVRRLATDLGLVHAASIDDVCAAVAARGGPVVVLDECDATLGEAATFGARLVREAPAASVLLVARAQPPVARTFELAPLDAAKGAELFVARARVVATLPRDAGAVETIARALDGNPLALTLAAARASAIGLAAIATRAARPLELLGASFREALEGVWSSLPDGERRVATALAIFPGVMRPEIAAAVAAAAVDDAGALDAVESLRNRSLLRAGPRGTLRMDPAVRELAREKLAADASLGAAKAAFARETLARAAALELAARVAFEPDLVAAFDAAAAAGDAETALAAALALEPVLVSRGPLDRLASMLDRALALPAAAAGARARALASRGRTATLQRDFDRAARCLTEASALAAGEPELEASTWLDRGVMHQTRGDFASAEECYATVLDVQDAAGASEARARGNLGALAHDRGDFDVAYTHYVRAIAVAEAIEDARLLGVFLCNLAVLDRERGRAAVARQRFLRALHALEDARDARLVGIALGNLGMLELGEDRVDPALAAFSRSAETLAAIGDAHSEALAQARLGAAEAVAGRVAASEAALARAERLAGRDETTLALVRFFRAFPEHARARLGGDGSETFAERARARAAAAEPLARTNDDVRCALAVLERLAKV